MRPVCAVLRVKQDGDIRVINVSAGDHAEKLARELVAVGARAAKEEIEEPGVYRLRIEGEKEEPVLGVTRIAEPDETVAVALVARDGEESVAVKDVKLSPGEGLELDEEAVEQALSEGVASCAEAIPIGEERTVEIVIPEDDE